MAKKKVPKVQKQKAVEHKDRLTRIHAMLEGCEKAKLGHNFDLHNKLIDLELKISTLSEVIKEVGREAEASRSAVLADHQKENKELKQTMGKRLDDGDAQVKMLAKKMDGISDKLENAREEISREGDKRKADTDKMLSKYKELNKEMNSETRGTKEQIDNLLQRISLAEVKISQGVAGELTEETRELDVALRELERASELADKNMLQDAEEIYHRALAIYMRNIAADSKNPIDRINLIELYGNLKHMQVKLRSTGMPSVQREIRPVQ